MGEDLARSGAERPEVVGLKLSRNFGQHPAIAAGLERARGDVTVLMDADLQDEPEQLPALLAKLDEGADVVYTVNVDDVGRRSLAPHVRALPLLVLESSPHVDVPQAIGTYRVFTRKFREALLRLSGATAALRPADAVHGLHGRVRPRHARAAAEGTSGYTFLKRLGLAVDTLVSYTNVPHRILLFLGTALAAASALYLDVL